jgi:hypothetical protein
MMNPEIKYPTAGGPRIELIKRPDVQLINSCQLKDKNRGMACEPETMRRSCATSANGNAMSRIRKEVNQDDWRIESRGMVSKGDANDACSSSE